MPALRPSTLSLSTTGSLLQESEQPIWLGSQRPALTGRPTWRASHDASLRRMTQDEGRPLLVVARNSDGAARKGCRAAAADAHDAIRELSRGSGWHLTECLPSVDEMAQCLIESPNRQKFTERNGKSFGLRSCLLDLSEIGVVISLSAGSAGLKLSRLGCHQGARFLADYRGPVRLIVETGVIHGVRATNA